MSSCRPQMMEDRSAERQWLYCMTMNARLIYHSGMPTVEGYVVCWSVPTITDDIYYRLRKALLRVDAGPGGRNTVHWTSLREASASVYSNVVSYLNVIQEPVVYVTGKPHVLRLVDRPYENVE